MPDDETADEQRTAKELFRQAGRRLRAQFEELKASNPHYAERGAEAEELLRGFLNDHLPQRFRAGSGFVVDERGRVSKQSDVLIYDALNSPIYRHGDRSLILPSDNVAAVIEVKSRLNKRQLEDAAKKIASVKCLKKSPPSNVDQPVTFSPLMMTRTMGLAFGYEADTSLESLAENLAEVNGEYPSAEWIDMVVVPDAGVLGYTIQAPFGQENLGWLGGACADDFAAPPYYVHLSREQLGELALNRFFLHLMHHLTLFRKRSTMTPLAALGEDKREVMVIHSYQYNLAKELVEVDEYHRGGNFHGPTEVFNIFSKADNGFLGQLGWIPWKDGGVISFSGVLPQERVLATFVRELGQDLTMTPGSPQGEIWLSSVLDLDSGRFSEIARALNGELVVRHEKEPGGDLEFLPDHPPGSTPSTE